jgi:hypothetical protein
MKTFVLTVSRTFPKTHKRSGQKTWFVEKINNVGMPISDDPILGIKIHTIRANYELWERRARQINDGMAILSVRYWSGKPYNSKQVEFCQLNKIGLQKLIFKERDLLKEIAISPDRDIFHSYTIADISKNDGLSFDDFKEWFKNYDLSIPMAIIHFTDYRY